MWRADRDDPRTHSGKEPMHALLSLSPRQKKITTLMSGGLLLLAAIAITTTLTERHIGIPSSRGSGLLMRREPMAMSYSARGAAQGIVYGRAGGIAEARLNDNDTEDAMSDRQVIRTASLAIFSNDPVQSAARAEQLAQSLGGFVVNSTVSGSARDEQSATLELRV